MLYDPIGWFDFMIDEDSKIYQERSWSTVFRYFKLWILFQQKIKKSKIEYQRVTPAGCKDKGSRKFKFVPKTKIHY